MTQAFEDMLRLLGAGSQGNHIDFDHQLNIEEIRWHSLHQGVWPIVHTALKLAYPDDEKITRYNKESVGHMVINMQKTTFVHRIMQKFESSGISCCVLKGEALAHLYFEPYSRISSDYDILIDEEKESFATRILKESGYEVEVRPRNHQHFVAKHPIAGALEVHVKMYSDTTRDIFLKGKVDYAEALVDIKTENGVIKTLGVNDNLIFLTIHFLKHYLTGEITLRQITDLLLYMKCYKGKYDVEGYRDLMGSLGFTQFIATVKGIGDRYLEINTDEDYDAELVDSMLADIEKVRYEQENVNIHSDIAMEKHTKGKVDYILYKEKHRYGKSKIFPGKSHLVEAGYKYASNTVLVPIAWAHRFINMIISAMNKKNLTKIKTERMELAKKLGLY